MKGQRHDALSECSAQRGEGLAGIGERVVLRGGYGKRADVLVRIGGRLVCITHPGAVRANLRKKERGTSSRRYSARSCWRLVEGGSVMLSLK